MILTTSFLLSPASLCWPPSRCCCLSSPHAYSLQLGSDGLKAQTQMLNVMRGMCGLVFVVTINFPSVCRCQLTDLIITSQAMFMYWLTSNCFSLSQTALFKIPGLKTSLKIPDMIVSPFYPTVAYTIQQHPAPPQQAPQASFMESLKSGIKVTLVHHYIPLTAARHMLRRLSERQPSSKHQLVSVPSTVQRKPTGPGEVVEDPEPLATQDYTGAFFF